METATVVQPRNVATKAAEKANRVDVHRYQKWADGEGKLWIVLLTFGFDNRGQFGANVSLLDVDLETEMDVTRVQFEQWVRNGTLKRVEGAILM